jgi:hypothetical protein
MEEIIISVKSTIEIITTSIRTISNELMNNIIFQLIIGVIIFLICISCFYNLIRFIAPRKEKEKFQKVGKEDYDNPTPIYDPFEDPSNYNGKTKKAKKEEWEEFTDERMYGRN